MRQGALDIEKFFNSLEYAVVGASTDRSKYGNKVLRCYLQHGKKVYPVNPREKEVEGLACISNISELPDGVKSISIITPPPVTEKIVEEAIKKGIKNIWMQPGAQSPKALERCRQNGINVIADGSCVLVWLGFKE